MLIVDGKQTLGTTYVHVRKPIVDPEHSFTVSAAQHQALLPDTDNPWTSNYSLIVLFTAYKTAFNDH